MASCGPPRLGLGQSGGARLGPVATDAHLVGQVPGPMLPSWSWCHLRAVLWRAARFAVRVGERLSRCLSEAGGMGAPSHVHTV